MADLLDRVWRERRRRGEDIVNEEGKGESAGEACCYYLGYFAGSTQNRVEEAAEG